MLQLGMASGFCFATWIPQERVSCFLIHVLVLNFPLLLLFMLPDWSPFCLVLVAAHWSTWTVSVPAWITKGRDIVPTCDCTLQISSLGRPLSPISLIPISHLSSNNRNHGTQTSTGGDPQATNYLRSDNEMPFPLFKLPTDSAKRLGEPVTYSIDQPCNNNRIFLFRSSCNAERDDSIVWLTFEYCVTKVLFSEELRNCKIIICYDAICERAKRTFILNLRNSPLALCNPWTYTRRDSSRPLM